MLNNKPFNPNPNVEYVAPIQNYDVEQTSDVFGRQLLEFDQLKYHERNSVPLIFHLLVGYFQANPDLLRTEGLFRVAAAPDHVTELEIHLAMRNYSFLTNVKDPHIVSNYFKTLMREMSEPICTFNLYDRFMSLPQAIDQIAQLKVLVEMLPSINFNTLKFTMAFCRTVVGEQEYNQMNTYNIAVTVGPNIFKSREDLSPIIYALHSGTMTQIVTLLLENFDEIFGSDSENDSQRLSCDLLIQMDQQDNKPITDNIRNFR